MWRKKAGIVVIILFGLLAWYLPKILFQEEKKTTQQEEKKTTQQKEKKAAQKVPLQEQKGLHVEKTAESLYVDESNNVLDWDGIDEIIKKDIYSLTFQMNRLLDAPIPNDIQPTIKESSGPAKQSPIYQYNKGMKFFYRTYSATPEDIFDPSTYSWIDFGEIGGIVESIEENGSARLKWINKSSTQINMPSISMKGEKSVPLEFPEMIFISKPNGEMLIDDKNLSIGMLDEKINVKMGDLCQNFGSVIFPEKEISLGEAWMIDDPSDKEGDSSIYTFEGYSTVNGTLCMKIRERSIQNSSFTLSRETDFHSLTITTKNEIHGTHYFDPAEGIIVYRDVVINQISVDCDDEMILQILKKKKASLPTTQRVQALLVSRTIEKQ